MDECERANERATGQRQWYFVFMTGVAGKQLSIGSIGKLMRLIVVCNAMRCNDWSEFSHLTICLQIQYTCMGGHTNGIPESVFRKFPADGQFTKIANDIAPKRTTIQWRLQWCVTVSNAIFNPSLCMHANQIISLLSYFRRQSRSTWSCSSSPRTDPIFGQRFGIR